VPDMAQPLEGVGAWRLAAHQAVHNLRRTTCMRAFVQRRTGTQKQCVQMDTHLILLAFQQGAACYPSKAVGPERQFSVFSACRLPA